MILGAAALLLAFILLGLDNTVGYHRLLTHRAFSSPRGVRWSLALLGALHAGPPLLWVGLHRLHHLESDQPGDPHSPRVEGFWHAHTGWLLGGWGRGALATPLAILVALSGFGQQVRTLFHDVHRLAGAPAPLLVLTADLAVERVIGFLDRPLVTPAMFLVQVALAGAFGWGGLVWLWALHVLLTNASWAVNSVCHTREFGRQSHDTGDHSQDVPWLGAVTLGEAWHNSHHRYPKSAWHSLGRGADLSWWAIRGLVAVRLASDPWLPREVRR